MWTETNTEEQVIKGILKYGPDILEHCFIDFDISKYQSRVETEHLNYPFPKNTADPKNWFMPEKYKTLDIEEWLLDSCPDHNYQRLHDELALFKSHDMLDLLKFMKYLVDTLRANNIVWGVGRGSSVASYALYLIGVHKIDSVKYNIPINEFFKEIQNG